MLLTNLFINDLLFFLPEFFLATAILTIILYGSFFSVSKDFYKPLINNSICWISIFTLICTGFLIFSTKNLSLIIFNGTFICDFLTQNAKIIIITTTIICLFINLSYIKYYNILKSKKNL